MIPPAKGFNCGLTGLLPYPCPCKWSVIGS
jgi:hypothetical protein